MSVSDDTKMLEQLEEERAGIASRPHDGYADATRFVRLESEIEAVQERLVRGKQRAEHGEG